MKALIVYESMFGATRAIAEAVADGFSVAFDTGLRPAAEVTAGDLRDADIVIVGAPTHVHGLPRSVTRRKATEMAASSHGALVLEPGAAGPGVREWLAALGSGVGKEAVVFDTRLGGMSPLLTGRASLRIAKRLRLLGFKPGAAPVSFLVGEDNRLLDGELDRARIWAKRIAERLAAPRMA